MLYELYRLTDPDRAPAVIRARSLKRDLLTARTMLRTYVPFSLKLQGNHLDMLERIMLACGYEEGASTCNKMHYTHDRLNAVVAYCCCGVTHIIAKHIA